MRTRTRPPGVTAALPGLRRGGCPQTRARGASQPSEEPASAALITSAVSISLLGH